MSATDQQAEERPTEGAEHRRAARHRAAVEKPLADAAAGPTTETVPQRATKDDIAHCRGALEVMEAVARLNGGAVHLRDTATLIVEAGASRSQHPDHVRVNLHRIASERPDWERADADYWVWTAMPDEPYEPTTAAQFVHRPG